MNDKIAAQRNIRLARFLLDEARERIENGENQSSDVVNDIIRQIGNQIVCGNESGRASSKFIKERNQRMTIEAKSILERKGFKEFHKLTMNEHQWPASSIWKYIIKNYINLTPEGLIKKLLEFPVTTLLKEQDTALRKQGKTLGDDPIKRYENLNITVINYLPKDFKNR